MSPFMRHALSAKGQGDTFAQYDNTSQKSTQFNKIRKGHMLRFSCIFGILVVFYEIYLRDHTLEQFDTGH
jgi:hypothetical protein